MIDQWSIDSWLITDSGKTVLPSRNTSTTQSLNYDCALSIKTTSTT
jgi:hypothetical protein